SYLKNIQIRNLTGNSNKKDHLNDEQSKLLEKVNRLFIEMNYQYFTGHNHIEKKQLEKLYSSKEFKILVSQRPRFSDYMKTLFDTSNHSNLNAKIWY
ncbi:MAG: metallophosphoesterase, partial [Lactobacillus sp.]|nr:metallophosphoesterase [Lactobacillus sp.]